MLHTEYGNRASMFTFIDISSIKYKEMFVIKSEIKLLYVYTESNFTKL